MTEQELLNVQTWLFIGILVLVFALLMYLLLWYNRGKTELRGYRIGTAIRSLLFRLPGAYPPPLVHVLLALVLFVGVSVTCAGATAWLARLDFHLTVELTSLVFGVLIALTALYTLWQTIRLEENQGLMVLGFRPFLERLVQDLALVVTSQGQSCLGRRVLIISTNPFFGTLSFKNDPMTFTYESHMDFLANLAKTGALRCEVICADSTALSAFHAGYFKNSPTAANDVVEADTRTNEFITRLDHIANKSVVRRIPNVPRVQFIIVGNVLHEFLLTAEDMHTEVRHVRRTEDMLIADRFAEFFNILK